MEENGQRPAKTRVALTSNSEVSIARGPRPRGSSVWRVERLGLAMCATTWIWSPAGAQTVSSRTNYNVEYEVTTSVIGFSQKRVSVDDREAALAIQRQAPSGAQVTIDSVRVQRPSWLGQGGLQLAGDQTARLNLEVYTYWLEWREGSTVPFVVLGNLPMMGREDFDDVVADVLSESGGTLNVGIGTRPWRPPLPLGLFGFSADSPFGWAVEARFGGKLVDTNAAHSSGDSNFVVLGTGTVHTKLLLPIWSDGRRRDENHRAGSVQGELVASFQWSKDRDFRSIFGDTELLSRSLFAINANLALILTDQLYAAVAMTVHADDERLERGLSASFKYLR